MDREEAMRKLREASNSKRDIDEAISNIMKSMHEIAEQTIKKIKLKEDTIQLLNNNQLAEAIDIFLDGDPDNAVIATLKNKYRDMVKKSLIANYDGKYEAMKAEVELNFREYLADYP